MNRQQRRAAGIPSKDPTRMMRQSDIDRIRQQAELDASAEAMALLFSLVIDVMHERYGWGRTRLGDLGEALVDKWSEVDSGSMTLKDYQDYVYKMTGVEFKTSD